MWFEKDLIIISDLHLAAERGRGLFQADSELAAFLSWVVDHALGSHLILAGDVLDYLALAPGNTNERRFNLKTARSHTDRIIDCHPEVFSALSRVAQSPDHRLTIQGGNHDPELALPDVQAAITQHLLNNSRTSSLHWSVHGTAAMFQVGTAKCLVEHGDHYDDWNCIDHDKLRQAVALVSRGITDEEIFSPPVGSELVVKYLTPLRQDYPWIDLLKPERETVLPIIREALPRKEQSKLLPGLLKLDTVARANSLIRWARRKINPKQLYREGKTPEDRQSRFRAWLQAIDPDRMMRGGQEEDRQTAMIQRLREVALEDGFFDIAAPDEAAEDVSFLMRQGTDVVIHGHTHAAKAYPLEQGLYLNSGTWGRLMKLPDGQAKDADWRTFLDGLKPEQKNYHSFLRATFVRLQESLDKNSVIATLAEWRDAHPATLAEWHFNGPTRTWQQASQL